MPKRPIKRHEKGQNKTKESKLSWKDEEIESSSGEESDGGIESNESENEGEKESTEQKRARLAKAYLASMTSTGEEEEEEDDDGGHRDLVAEKLRRDRLESQGKYNRAVAANLKNIDAGTIKTSKLTGHEASVTCLALTSDDRFCYSGSKDNAVVCWDVETGQSTFLRPTWKSERDAFHLPQSESQETSSSGAFRHSREGEVLAIAVSSDGNLLAYSGRDKLVHIYDTRTNQEIKAMKGHSGTVNCLAFRRASNALYSGSDDRCVKVWDLNEVGYLETLFGHQDPVYDIDAWTKEIPISCGADRTLRSWKIRHETHLVYRGHKSSIDTVTMLDDNRYMSGGQDGTLCLWKDTTKKPVAQNLSSHGLEGGVPRWICSLEALKMSDLVVSGSYDGYVRLWEADVDRRSIEETMSVPVGGVVNALAVSSKLIVAGTGRDHRYGRWFIDKSCKNELVVMQLPNTIGGSDHDDNDYQEDGIDGSGSDESEDESGEDSV